MSLGAIKEANQMGCKSDGKQIRSASIKHYRFGGISLHLEFRVHLYIKVTFNICLAGVGLHILLKRSASTVSIHIIPIGAAEE